MSERTSRLFVVLAVGVTAAAVATGLVLRTPALGARFTPDVSFPHSGSCFHPDKVTGPPCRAARELLLGANAGAPRLYCRHYAQRGEYRACVAGVAFSDPGFSAFQTVGFRVKRADVLVDGEAEVLVHVWPFDDPPTDAVIVMERQAGWWRVIDTKPAPPAPAS